MTARTMKSIQQHTFGGPEALSYESAPIPEIKSGELLVRVHSVGLNPPDWYLREGYKALPPEWRPPVTFPLILGTDVSGVVEAVADDVTDFKVGDEVYSMVRFPEGIAGESRAYAQYVNIPAAQAGIKPSKVDHNDAAAAPMSLLTAWQYLVDLGHTETNPLQEHQHQPVTLSGKKVLINGAAGGVGHFALQVAKLKGAYVIAVASGKHEAMLRELGADEFIDYTQTQAEKSVKELDLVVDCVGGPKSARFLQTLKKGGSLFPIFPLGFDAHDEAHEMGVNVSATQVRSNGKQLNELAELIDQGAIRVILDSQFKLSDAQKAHERASKGHIQGKIVLTVD